MNKRGLSNVVTATLLILLTISAITVVSLIVIPFARENLKESTRCSDVITGISVVNDKTCYDASVPQTNITIRFGDVNPDGLYLVAEDVVTSNLLTPSEYNISDIPQSGGGQKKYTFNNYFDGVIVGPIVNGKRCPISEEAKIQRC
tara:strand:+ start:183 stop:620 length:438 start_codon:yes stop_codon:yes gene_type:complete